MNEKDLMNGMTNIDEDLIEEASKPKKRTRFRSSSVVAASLALIIGAGSIFGGSVILKQRGGETSLTSVEQASTKSEMKTVGISDQAFGRYSVLSSYRELYKVLDAQSSNRDYMVESWEATSGGDGAMYDAAAEESTQTSGLSDYSGTNLMVEGIDESDIIKTDGEFVYMVQSGSVKVLDIREGAAQDGTVITPPFEAPSDVIRELYVDEDRLIIITEHAEERTARRILSSYTVYADQTMAYVYDISDPLEAELLGSMKQDGSYRTSRKIDDIVYLFTDQWIETDLVSEKNADDAEHVMEWVPSINDIPVDYDCIYLPETGRNSLVISSFEVEDPVATIDAKVVLSDTDEVYMGDSHIYLYGTNWTSARNLTAISSFSYEDGRIRMEADTSVGGSVLDSFAIHEKDGMLCVLTTDYADVTEVNTLYVLDEDLKQAGRIDEIARGEQIYAARYVGDMVYFITYKNTDPMFVADLSDVTNPKLLGNVEISGFSEYLHQWDETHILGIGYETTEASETLGMKLVMFDVSDPLHPEIENTLVIGGGVDEEASGWYYSAAVEYAYKGILADPGKNLIGFAYEGESWEWDDPIVYDESVEEDVVEDSTVLEDVEYADGDFQNYELFSYDMEKGFTNLLSTSIDDRDQAKIRGLYSGDWFYLGSYGELRSFSMENGFKESE